MSHRDLDGNAFICNCHLAWFADWLRREESLLASNGPKCNAPLRHKDNLIRSLPSHEFRCTSKQLTRSHSWSTRSISVRSGRILADFKWDEGLGLILPQVMTVGVWEKSTARHSATAQGRSSGAVGLASGKSLAGFLPRLLNSIWTLMRLNGLMWVVWVISSILPNCEYLYPLHFFLHRKKSTSMLSGSEFLQKKNRESFLSESTNNFFFLSFQCPQGLEQ